MESFPYTIELTPLKTDGFAVAVPALPGCVTWGKSFSHAVTMAKEAIDLWIEDMSERGELIPEPSHDPKPINLAFARDEQEWVRLSEQSRASKILASLKKEGFVERRKAGAHTILRNENRSRAAIVAVQDSKIPALTLKSVLQQAASNKGQFEKLLSAASKRASGFRRSKVSVLARR